MRRATAAARGGGGGAAYLELEPATIAAVRVEVEGFSLPALTEWQRMVVSRSLRFVGSPYVWAGTSERPQQLFGRTLPGGFDCSGFVWRVYKLQSYAGGAKLGPVLRGRTAAAMAGEVGPRRRIQPARLAPADLVFFGQGGPRAKPTQVDHMGIYAGNGWMIHSSRYGVTLVPLTGWYSARLAWGRRPLAEAAL